MESQPTSSGRTTADEARNRAVGAGVVDDPYPTLHDLRSRCPIHRGSTAEAFGLASPSSLAGEERQAFSVLGYQDALRVFRDHATFSSTWFQRTIGPTVGNALIALDPPEHQRHRSLLQPAFAPHEMERWEHQIVRPVVARHLEGLVPRGRADLYAEFAAYVPVDVTAEALGLPADDRELFVNWAVTMTSMAEPVEARLAASRAVEDYIGPLVAERRAHGGEDLLGLLVQAQVPDDTDADVGREPLSDKELADFVRLLIVAGASTVLRGYGVLAFGLLSDPGQLRAVRDDRSLIPQAIEEALRWEQPVTMVGRTCTRQVELDGTTIPEGSDVLLEIGAANHDPSTWPEPERFDIFRPSKQHLAFGFGRHRCLGVYLARMELRVMLEATLDSFPNLRFDPAEPAPHVTGMVFRMVTGLPVVWDPI
jgi:cytochrome P450